MIGAILKTCKDVILLPVDMTVDVIKEATRISGPHQMHRVDDRLKEINDCIRSTYSKTDKFNLYGDLDDEC